MRSEAIGTVSLHPDFAPPFHRDPDWSKATDTTIPPIAENLAKGVGYVPLNEEQKKHMAERADKKHKSAVERGADLLALPVGSISREMILQKYGKK